MLYAITDLETAVTWLASARSPGQALDLAETDGRCSLRLGVRVEPIESDEPLQVQTAPDMDGATEQLDPAKLDDSTARILGVISPRSRSADPCPA